MAGLSPSSAAGFARAESTPRVIAGVGALLPTNSFPPPPPYTALTLGAPRWDAMAGRQIGDYHPVLEREGNAEPPASYHSIGACRSAIKGSFAQEVCPFLDGRTRFRLGLPRKYAWRFTSKQRTGRRCHFFRPNHPLRIA